MAIAIASQGEQNDDGTYSWTVAAGNNRLLVIMAGLDDDSDNVYYPLSVCTYGGTSLTKLASSDYQGEACELWYMIAPPVGTANIVVTQSVVAPQPPWFTFLNFTGVNQSSPFRANSSSTTGATSTIADTVTSATNDFVITVCSGRNKGIMTVGSGGTLIEDERAGNNTSGTSYYTAVASSTATGWSFANSDGNASMISASIIPASGAGGSSQIIN